MTRDIDSIGWHAESTKGAVAAGAAGAVDAGLQMLEAGGKRLLGGV